MTGRVVVAEFAKMRRLRTLPVLAVMVVGVVAFSSLTFTAPGFLDAVDDPDARPWQWLLGGPALAVALISPLLLAIVAGRQVDIEHQGNGWFLSQTSGVTAGGLCRAKFVATGSLVAGATLAQSALVAALGWSVGISTAFPTGQWLGHTTSVLVINLVLLALHILLSARVPNQLVSLGVGVLGTFVALTGTGLPPWIGHLVPPWSYYGLVIPVDLTEVGVIDLDPHHPSVIVLGVVGGAVFLALTRLFDRQEAR